MHGGRKSPLSTEVARATTYQPLSDDSRDHTNAIANSTSTALGVRLMGQCEVVNGAAAAVHVHAHAHFNDADDEDDEDWEFFQATGPQTRFPTTSTAQPPHAPTPPSKSREKRKLTIAIALCTLFFLIELVGGFLASSLAVLNDAFHLLSDLLSFVISLSAIYISTWAATRRKSVSGNAVKACCGPLI